MSGLDWDQERFEDWDQERMDDLEARAPRLCGFRAALFERSRTESAPERTTMVQTVHHPDTLCGKKAKTKVVTTQELRIPGN